MSAPSTLAQSAVCYCYDDGTFKSVAIYLLAAKAGLLSMSPNALASAASCYCFRDDTWKSVVAYLLDAINSGGGGGTTCVTGGIGAPSGAPPCTWSIYTEQPVLPQTIPGLWINVGNTWFNVLGTGPA